MLFSNHFLKSNKRNKWKLSNAIMKFKQIWTTQKHLINHLKVFKFLIKIMKNILLENLYNFRINMLSRKPLIGVKLIRSPKLLLIKFVGKGVPVNSLQRDSQNNQKSLEALLISMVYQVCSS